MTVGGTLATLLTKESFEQYLKDSRLKALAVQGLSDAKLLIDPLRKRVALQASTKQVPDLATTEKLTWDTISLQKDGSIFGELSVLAEDQMYEGYLLLADVAAELADSHDLQKALEEATGGFTELLTLQSVLSPEKQLGLVGELLIIREIVLTNEIDPVGFWLGPEKSEHDFKFLMFDLEVKTTTSEMRKHKIATISQLLPSQGRELFLASIQLTRASKSSGFSLFELATELLASKKLDSQALSAKLVETGWKAKHNHLYTSRFELRSEILIYEVNEEFPKLTQNVLALAAAYESRITDISYRVNLDGLPSVSTLRQFIQRAINAG